MACQGYSHIQTEKVKYHKTHQENVGGNSSVITTLVITTLAIVGFVFAAHFGAFSLSPDGFIICYATAGVSILGTIAAVVYRCIGCAQPVEFLDRVYVNAQTLVESEGRVVTVRAQKSIVVCLSNGAEYVAVKDADNRDKILYSPLVELADDFDVALIPKGKILFVKHQDSVKKVTREGFEPLLKTTMSAMRKSELLLPVLSLEDGIGYLDDTEFDSQVLIAVLVRDKMSILSTSKEYDGHYTFNAISSSKSSVKLFCAKNVSTLAMINELKQYALYLEDNRVKIVNKIGKTTQFSREIEKMYVERVANEEIIFVKGPKREA